MATIDTSLPPEPSGAAAALAARHSDSHQLKLYGGWFCPFVQRSWIVLEEKKIPYQYIEINPYKKAASFLAMNPRGLVPTLAVPAGAQGTEQKPLFESNIISEYLDEEYSDESKYGPTHRREAIHAGGWQGGAPQHIHTLTEQMDPDGPFFAGKELTMVDICLAPWAKRLWLIDHYKNGGVGIPAQGQDEEWERWRTWFKAITERKSVTDTWSADERYIIAYKRYADDTTNSEVGQATRKGNRLP